MARVAKRIELERKQIKEHEARKAAMFTRAVKGISPKVEINPDYPRAGVVILTAYIGRLEVMMEDLEAEFGDLQQFHSASSWLRMEISLALEALVKLKIKIEAGP